MSIDQSDDKMIPKNTPTDTDAFEEAIASQEEISLEKKEEQMRAALISEDPSRYVQQETVCVDCCLLTDSPEKNRGGE